MFWNIRSAIESFLLSISQKYLLSIAYSESPKESKKHQNPPEKSKSCQNAHYRHIDIFLDPDTK